MKRVLLMALAMVCAFVGFGFAPARGLSGDKLSIDAKPGSKVSGTYGPMPVNDASSAFTDDPEKCETLPWCTTVPIDVNLPAGFDPDVNEFFLTVAVSWDDSSIAGAAQGNDLDTYVYSIETDADGNNTYTEVGKSAGSTMPEVSKLFEPLNTHYVLVVYNFLGVNKGFNVDINFIDASITDPDSGFTATPAAGPIGGDGGSTGGGSVTPPPSGASSGGAHASAPFSPDPSPSFLPASNPTLSPSVDLPPIGTDDVFGDFGDLQDFQKDLQADAPKSGIDLLAASRRQLGPPKDVGASVLVFWLIGVPVVLAGAAFVVLLRRRPSALTLTIPS
jgi:hypothetical protein